MSKGGSYATGSGARSAFRFVAVLFSAVLIRFWIFKVIGGLYLLYLAVAHFLPRESTMGSCRMRQAGERETRGGDGYAASGGR